MGNCTGCLVVHKAKRLPYYCMCGLIYIGPNNKTNDYQKSQTQPRTFSNTLRELLGCGCHSLPWKKWETHGLDWCRDNTELIAKKIAAEPKTQLNQTEAMEKVQLAIKIAERYSQ